ncbi:hypothetical protein UFOVP68_22 [uncultured Caudovirales phage]|uniref:Holin n=1 Tax=uncultured Caudovirales phage TaxID=2100421 RepID=A0A6J5L163_9CAUD|nr:hypothetical protein UFOVP68_22 [uncultured Caudovirales phage]
MLQILKPFILSTARHVLTGAGAAAVTWAAVHPAAQGVVQATGLNGSQISTAIVGVGMAALGQALSWAEKAKR